MQLGVRILRPRRRTPSITDQILPQAFVPFMREVVEEILPKLEVIAWRRCGERLQDRIERTELSCDALGVAPVGKAQTLRSASSTRASRSAARKNSTLRCRPAPANPSTCSSSQSRGSCRETWIDGPRRAAATCSHAARARRAVVSSLTATMTSALTCLREVLADLRPNTRMLADMQATVGRDAALEKLAGTVTVDLRRQRVLVLARLELDDELVTVDDPATRHAARSGISASSPMPTTELRPSRAARP